MAETLERQRSDLGEGPMPFAPNIRVFNSPDIHVGVGKQITLMTFPPEADAPLAQVTKESSGGSHLVLISPFAESNGGHNALDALFVGSVELEFV